LRRPRLYQSCSAIEEEEEEEEEEEDEEEEEFYDITKAQLLGSRLKQWNVLEKGAIV
jgi:hypothetical protein